MYIKNFSDSIKKSNKLCKAASIDVIEERIKYNLAQAPFNKKKINNSRYRIYFLQL